MSDELKQAASDALFVQCACNLSGVVYSFARAMDALNKERSRLNEGTDWIKNHPVCRLFAEQIQYLTSGKGYSEACDECEELAGEKKEAVG